MVTILLVDLNLLDGVQVAVVVPVVLGDRQEQVLLLIVLVKVVVVVLDLLLVIGMDLLHLSLIHI